MPFRFSFQLKLEVFHNISIYLVYIGMDKDVQPQNFSAGGKIKKLERSSLLTKKLNKMAGNVTCNGKEHDSWHEWIGHRVCVGGTKNGILRYFGKTHFAEGFWCGVELDEPVGKNNGVVKNVKYFSCKDNYGIFVPLAKTSRILEHCEKERSVACIPVLGIKKKVSLSGPIKDGNASKKVMSPNHNSSSKTSLSSSGRINEHANCSQNDLNERASRCFIKSEKPIKPCIFLEKSIRKLEDLNKTVTLDSETFPFSSISKPLCNGTFSLLSSEACLNSTFKALSHENADNQQEKTFILDSPEFPENLSSFTKEFVRSDTSLVSTDDNESLGILSAEQMIDFPESLEQEQTYGTLCNNEYRFAESSLQMKNNPLLDSWKSVNDSKKHSAVDDEILGEKMNKSIDHVLRDIKNLDQAKHKTGKHCFLENLEDSLNQKFGIISMSTPASSPTKYAKRKGITSSCKGFNEHIISALEQISVSPIDRIVSAKSLHSTPKLSITCNVPNTVTNGISDIGRDVICGKMQHLSNDLPSFICSDASHLMKVEEKTVAKQKQLKVTDSDLPTFSCSSQCSTFDESLPERDLKMSHDLHCLNTSKDGLQRTKTMQTFSLMKYSFRQRAHRRSKSNPESTFRQNRSVLLASALIKNRKLSFSNKDLNFELDENFVLKNSDKLCQPLLEGKETSQVEFSDVFNPIKADCVNLLKTSEELCDEVTCLPSNTELCFSSSNPFSTSEKSLCCESKMIISPKIKARINSVRSMDSESKKDLSSLLANEEISLIHSVIDSSVCSSREKVIGNTSLNNEITAAEVNRNGIYLEVPNAGNENTMNNIGFRTLTLSSGESQLGSFMTKEENVVMNVTNVPDRFLEHEINVSTRTQDENQSYLCLSTGKEVGSSLGLIQSFEYELQETASIQNIDHPDHISQVNEMVPSSCVTEVQDGITALSGKNGSLCDLQDHCELLQNSETCSQISHIHRYSLKTDMLSTMEIGTKPRNSTFSGCINENQTDCESRLCFENKGFSKNVSSQASEVLHPDISKENITNDHVLVLDRTYSSDSLKKLLGQNTSSLSTKCNTDKVDSTAVETKRENSYSRRVPSQRNCKNFFKKCFGFQGAHTAKSIPHSRIELSERNLKNKIENSRVNLPVKISTSQIKDLSSLKGKSNSEYAKASSSLNELEIHVAGNSKASARMEKLTKPQKCLPVKGNWNSCQPISKVAAAEVCLASKRDKISCRRNSECFESPQIKMKSAGRQCYTDAKNECLKDKIHKKPTKRVSGLPRPISRCYVQN